MADKFVRNAADGGDNGNSGAAWDAAKATIVGGLAVASDGDRVIVASDYAQTVSGDLDFTGAGFGSCKEVISATKAVNGTAVTYAAGATATCNDGDVQFIGCLNFHGLTFVHTGAAANSISIGATTAWRRQQFYNCSFTSTRQIVLGIINNNVVEMYGCALAVNVDDNHLILNYNYDCRFLMRGGSITSSVATASYGVFDYMYGGMNVRLESVDLSALNNMVALSKAGIYGPHVFAGCKLPSGWTDGQAANAYDCQGYILIERSSNAARTQTAAGLVQLTTVGGRITHDTSTFRTGGATDGGSPYSWKLKGDTSRCGYAFPLVSPPITAWCDGDGIASHDITVHFASDTALTDATIWFELLYPAETSTHQDGFVTTRRAVGATGSAYGAGDAWDGTEADNTYMETFSITPTYPGPITLRVYVATSADDIYVCPDLEIT